MQHSTHSTQLCAVQTLFDYLTNADTLDTHGADLQICLLVTIVLLSDVLLVLLIRLIDRSLHVRCCSSQQQS